MEDYKKEFIEFLVNSDALRFGEFKLKSGRISPYFINTGMFNDGKKIGLLGKYYAKGILQNFKEEFDAIYGPAYKGIPLCITTAIGLQKLGINKGYVFNRKEQKDHGEGKILVGTEINSDTNLIIVDDVITSGAAIRESLEILKDKAKIKGIILSVDREEKGTGEINALKQLEEEIKVPIKTIITLSEIKEYLHNKEIDGKVFIDNEILKKMDEYYEQYGAKR